MSAALPPTVAALIKHAAERDEPLVFWEARTIAQALKEAGYTGAFDWRAPDKQHPHQFAFSFPEADVKAAKATKGTLPDLEAINRAYWRDHPGYDQQTKSKAVTAAQTRSEPQRWEDYPAEVRAAVTRRCYEAAEPEPPQEPPVPEGMIRHPVTGELHPIACYRC